MPQVRSAAVAFYVSTGSRHEPPELHGASHFLEHLCFKGTATRSSREINVRFDELGSIYNAYTGKEHTTYYGWVPAERASAQFELLADMMRPALPPQEFETERQVVLEEIAMSDDDFDRHVWNAVHEALFGSHPLAHEILGRQESIAAMTRDALLAYHAQHYNPQRLTVLAAGSLEPEQLFAAVGRACANWPPGEPPSDPPDGFPPLTFGVRKRVLPRFKQQSLVLLYPSVPSGHADDESVETLVSILGGPNSRCYWNIIRKGICIEAGALWLAYRDYGALVLYADGQPERCEEMLAALRQEARAICQEGPRPAEVRRVKNRRRTQLALETENPRTRLMQMVDDLETKGYVRTPAARLAAAEAVSEQTIMRYLWRCPIDGEGLLLSCGPRDWP